MPDLNQRDSGKDVPGRPRLCDCAFLVILLLAPIRPETPLSRHEYSLQRMGTLLRIVLYTSEENTASLAAHAAFDRVERLEQILSDYREDSEAQRLCRDAIWTPKAVSPELYYVLDKALRISHLTGGAFDVTVGPVTSLWREARRARRMPDPQALAKAKEAVGYGNLVLKPSNRTVLLKRKGMKLDFGGIAKGYSADEALKVLHSHGVRSALIDFGGDIVLGDPPPGESGWKIAVFDPKIRPARFHYLMLHNLGVATSGDAYQYLNSRGRRYSHIVNPASSTGITDSVSTTLIAPDGITADALATALSILPVEEAVRIADSMEGVSVSLARRVDSWVRRFDSTRFPPEK
jgi:thiamine biosynthesis lipoprotein